MPFLLEGGFNLEFLLKGLIAAALGGVVGMEREYASRQRDSTIFAGARTFPLIGLLGCLAGFLNARYPGMVMLAAAAFLTFYALRFYKLRPGAEKGMTTELASLVVFFNGVIIWEGYFFLATAFTILTTLLLSLKPEIRGLLRHVDRREIFTFLQFLILVGVMLPILPDRFVDPYQAINPRKLGYVVVLISGLSYMGYILGRWRGARQSILITAVVGGLISSTALTWEFAFKSRRHPHLRPLYAWGMVVASAIMFFRIAVLLLFLSRELFSVLALWLGGIGLIGGGYALWRLWKESRKGEPGGARMAVRNPLNLLAALQFVLLIAAILVGGKVLLAMHGTAGLQALTVVSSVVNVDAIVVSVAQYFSSQVLPLSLSGALIFLALGVNSFAKWLIAWGRGGWSFAYHSLVFMLLMGGLAIAGWLWMT